MIEEQEAKARELPRSRGGFSEIGEGQVRIAITAAATYPGFQIKLHRSIPNMANGNCAFESATDQLNHTRNCQSNNDFANLGAFRFKDHTTLREAVVNDLKNNQIAQENSGYAGRRREYRTELNELLIDRVWNVDMGDLVLPGIAFTTSKILLVYNLSLIHI